MENKHKLTTDEIIKMCDRLKYKYPQHGLREDLKSEAILAIYGRLETHPDTHPAELYNFARLAMFDFVNLKDRTVAVPANPTTRAIAGNQYVPKSSEYSTKGLLAIQEALQPSMEYGDKIVETTEDCSKAYENKDFITKAMELLSEREQDVVKMRYFQHKTQEEVADIYDVTQQSVSIWEEGALDKMSKL